MTTSRQPASAPVPLAYGLDLAPGRLLLAKSVRAAPATLLCDCPLDASGAPAPPQAAAALAAARADVLA
ncbi:MAG: hypothetical protein IJT88_07660, partial [Kiritimatiellae bacterium]|nr:hypothetical protein [Kiritimatiellia bacterium]